MSQVTLNLETLSVTPARTPDITVEAAIARFGALHVIGVATLALLSGRGRRNVVELPDMVSDHIRRDIGLSPRQASPPADLLTRHMW